MSGLLATASAAGTDTDPEQSAHSTAREDCMGRFSPGRVVQKIMKFFLPVATESSRRIFL